MPYNKYIPISEDRFDALIKRSEDFIKAVGSATMEPVKVFEPLPPKLLEELLLVREVSKALQKKKEEEMKNTKGEEADKVEVKEDISNGTAEIPVKV